MLVAIHQPNFFPWLGFFNKIARADVFCLLDNAQFQKTGGSWTNRVQLAIHGKGAWVTAPVNRSWTGVKTIAEIKLHTATPWRENLLKTLQTVYGRAPFFREVFPFLRPLVVNPAESLAEYNVAAIRAVCAVLGLNRCRLVLGSTLPTEGTATELLLGMVRAVGGTAYLCGGGAGGYQEDHKFAEAGMQLIYQSYQHPVYAQSGLQFVSGLSAIDALMNCGFAETARLVKPG